MVIPTYFCFSAISTVMVDMLQSVAVRWSAASCVYYLKLPQLSRVGRCCHWWFSLLHLPPLACRKLGHRHTIVVKQWQFCRISADTTLTEDAVVDLCSCVECRRLLVSNSDGVLLTEFMLTFPGITRILKALGVSFVLVDRYGEYTVRASMLSVNSLSI